MTHGQRTATPRRALASRPAKGDVTGTRGLAREAGASVGLLRAGIAAAAVCAVGAVVSINPAVAEQNASPATATVTRTESVSRSESRTASQLAEVGGAKVDAALTARTQALTANSRTLQTEVQRLKAEEQKKAAAAAAKRAEEARLQAEGQFYWPTAGGVSSPWGMRFHPILHYTRLHGGVDIGGAIGAPIYAVLDGTVSKAASGHNSGSGNNVRISHGTIRGNQLESSYLHMNSFVVSAGQQVKRGQLIGYVGNTGLSTAPHLHFSVYVNGVNSDPMAYLKK